MQERITGKGKKGKKELNYNMRMQMSVISFRGNQGGKAGFYFPGSNSPSVVSGSAAAAVKNSQKKWSFSLCLIIQAKKL